MDYSLSGPATHATSQSDRETGQISVAVGVELDHETKDRYSVTVRAVDPSGLSDTIRVTINVTDVDETPTLSRTGLVAVGTREHQLPGERQGQGGGLLGAGAECRQRKLEAQRARRLRLLHKQPRGAESFRSTPNFESPADSDRDNVYELTVAARSGRELDELDVTVDVYNVDEEGEVKLTPTRGTIGARITAEMTDPDGDPTSVSWEWSQVGDRGDGVDADPRDEL